METNNAPALPKIVDRETWHQEVERLRVREKAHTREGDAIAAARRRLPMVEVDPSVPVVGAQGTVSLLDVFEGRRILFAYYSMWHDGKPAKDQCDGCTFSTSQVSELSYLHVRDVTYANLSQGTYEESVRYRDFMGWELPWYSARESGDALLVGRKFGTYVCYLRDGERVFETHWGTGRANEALANSYRLLDLTVYGRQEPWEDSPDGWPQSFADAFRTDGRPTAQWPRIEAGWSDDLTGRS